MFEEQCLPPGWKYVRDFCGNTSTVDLYLVDTFGRKTKLRCPEIRASTA